VTPALCVIWCKTIKDSGAWRSPNLMHDDQGTNGT
jgi:hypothetical protein